MTWRDRLRPPSFRGVPFKVAAAESNHGRNLVEHEYPDQAPPFVEDMGRRPRVFDVEGYVLGDDYAAQLQRIIEAAEEEGSGELVHPYRGTLRVFCRGLTVRELAREGRLARFIFSFVESSDPVAPEATLDPLEDMAQAVGSLFKASEEDFVQAWNPVDEPAILVEAGAAQAAGFWDYLDGLQLRGPIAAVGEFRDRLAEVADQTIDLLLAPATFSSTVTGLLGSLLEVIGSRKAAIEALLGLYRVEPSLSFGFSFASKQADHNRDAVGKIFREAAVALAAQASAEVPWASYDEALVARARALEALRGAQDASGDQAFRELANVARALAQALPLTPGTLPRIESYDVRESSSTLVLAYKIYDDVGRSEEIAIRNAISNPLIVAGGRTLEVLSRA